jgi:hypothetical protein
VGVLGDSRTASTLYGEWPVALIAGLNSDYAGDMVFTEENPRNWAVNGYDIAEAAAAIDGWLTSHSAELNVDKFVFFINFGIIESVGETEANFKSNYLYIIDALQTKFPGCVIFVTYPGAGTAPTRHDTLAPWLNDIIASRSNVYAGDDEETQFEGADNYATYYYDGLHYNAAAHALKPVKLRERTLAVLGW